MKLPLHISICSSLVDSNHFAVENGLIRQVGERLHIVGYVPLKSLSLRERIRTKPPIWGRLDTAISDWRVNRLKPQASNATRGAEKALIVGISENDQRLQSTPL